MSLKILKSIYTVRITAPKFVYTNKECVNGITANSLAMQYGGEKFQVKTKHVLPYRGKIKVQGKNYPILGCYVHVHRFLLQKKKMQAAYDERYNIQV